ncbi:hypothetical protein [Arthrobacter oryzae]|uniref:hypothetical protein n=1 Tax=Arthrobacter oryzae TaxID=409290 RepID=UPI002787068A|nr:hypothetical protein [Arthrobacter oryzae]MDQ0075780.1 hypothetical protein [Arthrobacter oryzae]
MKLSPGPFELAVSAPAEWWQIVAALGPLAVLAGAVLAAFIGWRTLRQKAVADAQALTQRTRADDRAEWWKRTQWALDKALEADADAKALGLASLAVLARSDLAREEELELLDIAWQSVTEANGDGGTWDGEVEAVDSEEPIGDNGTTSTDSTEEGKS